MARLPTYATKHLAPSPTTKTACYTPISLADASLAIMASMTLLQKGTKRGRSASECRILRFSAIHHAFLHAGITLVKISLR